MRTSNDEFNTIPLIRSHTETSHHYFTHNKNTPMMEIISSRAVSAEADCDGGGSGVTPECPKDATSDAVSSCLACAKTHGVSPHPVR